ncbi:hypothetical protein BZA77DRAFT_298776 [Pyronema omphalodes]|nr:hypothetical protein BZA77DRAFT_298776 [Pyronema omphalodes]
MPGPPRPFPPDKPPSKKESFIRSATDIIKFGRRPPKRTPQLVISSPLADEETLNKPIMKTSISLPVAMAPRSSANAVSHWGVSLQDLIDDEEFGMPQIPDHRHGPPEASFPLRCASNFHPRGRRRSGPISDRKSHFFNHWTSIDHPYRGTAPDRCN